MDLAKGMLWEEIIESIKDICPFIKIVFDQKHLLKKSWEAVETITKHLEELGISDKTATILEVKKTFTEKNPIL